MKKNIDLKDLRRLRGKAPNRRTAERLLAVSLRSEGMTPPQIAGIIGRDVGTVRRWIKLFNEGGAQMLEYKHSGGRVGKITKADEAILISWLKSGESGGGKWTLSALSEKLRKERGIQISQQQISEKIRDLRLSHLISRPRLRSINPHSRSRKLKR